jgi:hypothetical protein
MRSAFVLASLATIVVASLPASASAAPRDAIATAPPDDKDPGTATWLAVGSTAAGAGLALIATYENDRHNRAANVLGISGGVLLFLGPSAGHFYAGEIGHGAVTSALRAGAAAGAFFGLFIATFNLCAEPCHKADNPEGWALFGVSAAAFVGATAYDLYDAHRAVERANRRGVDLTIAPTVIPTATGPTGGLALVGTW